MIRRREFITLGGAAAAWPLAARAQQRALPVIGLLSSRSPDIDTSHISVIRQALNEKGLVEGQSVAAFSSCCSKVQQNLIMEVAAFKWLMIAAMIIGFGTCTFAQDIDVGKTEYQSSCAACHGIDAKGNGPVSKELKTRPADLTVLAKTNNGVFPDDMVYQMIDGRNRTVASHGTREMPIWGYRFEPPQAFRYK